MNFLIDCCLNKVWTAERSVFQSIKNFSKSWISIFRFKGAMWAPPSSVVNFINISIYSKLLFAQVQKAQKHLRPDWVLMFWRATGVKAVSRYVDEIDPCSQFHQHSMSSFYAHKSRKRKKTLNLSFFVKMTKQAMYISMGSKAADKMLVRLATSQRSVYLHQS